MLKSRGGKQMNEERPHAVRLEEVKTEFFKDGVSSTFVSNKAWDIGMYFMEPEMDTIVFSTEEEDDGSAEEWYGWAYEFYLVLVGEFTIWYGKDPEALRNKDGPHNVVRAGEVVSFPPGYKYLVRNTSKIPGTFFWGKSAPLKGVKMRENTPLKELE